MLAAVAVLAGCGGRAHSTAPAPRLGRALAARLAAQSDLVAARIRAGDTCGARSAARVLNAQTIAAVRARSVPGPLQEPLMSAANDLVARVPCATASPVLGTGGLSDGHKRQKHPHGHGDGGEGGD